MNKQKQTQLLILGAVIAIIVVGYFITIKPEIPGLVSDKGVTLRAFITDELGNKIQEIGTSSLAIVGGELGNYIVIESMLAQTSEGTAKAKINSVTGNVGCGSGNPSPNCASVLNLYQGDGILGIDGEGDIGKVYANAPTPILLEPYGQLGASDLIRSSEAIDVNQLAFGDMLFSLTANADYLDADSGNWIIFPSAPYGALPLNIMPENCEDGTLRDQCTNSISYGGEIVRGKKCVFNQTSGKMGFVADAGNCGCCRPELGQVCGWEPQGNACTNEICGTPGWTSGTCNQNTIEFCTLLGNIELRCNSCDGNGIDNTWGTVDDKCVKNAYNDYAESCASILEPSDCDWPNRNPSVSVSLAKQ